MTTFVESAPRPERAATPVPDRKPQRHAMSARLSEYVQLERELRRRGTQPAELARKAQLHPSTISHALADRPLTLATIRAIVQALNAIPPLVLGDSGGEAA